MIAGMKAAKAVPVGKTSMNANRMATATRKAPTANIHALSELLGNGIGLGKLITALAPPRIGPRGVLQCKRTFWAALADRGCWTTVWEPTALRAARHFRNSTG